MQICSSCFHSTNGNSSSSTSQNGHSDRTNSQHAGADDSLPIPETPVIRNHKSSSSNGKAAAQAPAGEEETAAATEADMAAQAPSGPAEGAASSDDAHMFDSGAGSSVGQPAWQAAAELGLALGDPDCELLGPGWKLQAHKQVLKSE
jgi:hypothetical protein